MQEIHRKPAPSRITQAAEFLVYLLGIVSGVVLIAIASYVVIPTMMWIAVPFTLGLYTLYRIKTIFDIVEGADSSRPDILEQLATRVLIGSIIAAAAGAGLTATGTPVIGIPMVLIAFPVAFLAFGIKLEWAARRARRRSLLLWDLLGRGSLLAFGIWITLEMVLVIVGAAALKIPTFVGDLLAVVGVVVPFLYVLLERPTIRRLLLQIDVNSVAVIITQVPALEYWTPLKPLDGEAWRRVTKPDDAPSIRDEPSNRRYSANR
ncbi:hypothetical protein [Natrialba sp. SSL1]|uniref:hypothetical protein n=1 Tax=Natrialba sp. SSL1 TaxID=1869245 RepID=UPI0008F8A971|nr:hypothetical protein [Natrialba sp. SSL1]OIB57339.1 hypothetical protein BBD46_02315 [Natrialba sp. SSL1]